MTIHYHRAIVHISPYYDVDAAARAFLEAKIDLYRRSQMNNEEGRMFLIARPATVGVDALPGDCEVFLFRTDDDRTVAYHRAVLGNDFIELTESEIVGLFSASQSNERP